MFVLCGFSQNSHATITLKSGVVITGQVKELVATDHVTIIVAGIESEISISDIASIETTEPNTITPIKEGNNTSVSELKYGEFKILDSKDYPESITIDLQGEQFEMILIRGGWLNMGYDDRHSLSMKTEPVHQVILTSFYICKTPINNHVADFLLSGKMKNKKKSKNFITSKWERANEIAQKLSENKNLPFRIISEAEWEYASLMLNSDEIFGKDKVFEWCFDYMEDYDSRTQTNPLGPSEGKGHVYRSYNIGRNKWQRKFSNAGYFDTEVSPCVRLVINAEFIKQTII